MANGDNNTSSSNQGRVVNKQVDEFLGIILLVGALIFLLVQLTGFSQERFCINPQQPRSFFQQVSISSTTPAGSCVRATEDLDVYESPGGTIIGTQFAAERGRIIGEAASAQDLVWRNVDFRTGVDGWVRQFELVTDPTITLSDRFAWYVNLFTTTSTIISLTFLAIIIYSTVRITQIRREEREELERLTRRALRAKESVSNQRWDHVMEHIESPNEGDWRTAILEADVMLDEMMETMGYTGDSLGDKLKEVEKSDFNTIDKAWEAHKKRNKIAHEGHEYSLTQREAQQIISLYEDVFEEFNYI